MIKKEFDTVETFRKIKEKMSKELFGKTPKQIMEYLKLNSMNFSKK